MPLEVCKLSRSSRSKICRETDYAIPNKGYCASQKMHYYGYKLHAVCSAEGVFQSVVLHDFVDFKYNYFSFNFSIS
ncbi:hypothetical protein [Empedobacter falsenii]|uniref:hypothetical protein n=1 Tax=Empedobacter falsenii TaxID=343874 RepID=UPI003A807B29